MLAALGAAGAAALVANAGEREAVLALSRTVPAGAVISEGDLAVVEVATEGALRPLAATERSRVVGRTAAVTLVGGSLLVEAQLADRLAPGPSQSVVAVVLKGGRVPPASLRPGERVQVVQTAAGVDVARSEGPAQLATVLGEARVLAVDRTADSAGSVQVSLAVEASLAPAVAGAGAVERVSLVVIPAQP